MITLWHMLVEVSPLVEIGHRCMQVLRNDEQCCEIATHEQAWPGSGYRPICEHHLATALRLAEVFCFVLPVRPLAVWRRADEPEDPTATKEAALELN